MSWGGAPPRLIRARPRAWTLECLMAARVLAAAGAPLTHIGFALDRQASDIDRALWILVGRTPHQALTILQGGTL